MIGINEKYKFKQGFVKAIKFERENALATSRAIESIYDCYYKNKKNKIEEIDNKFKEIIKSFLETSIKLSKEFYFVLYNDKTFDFEILEKDIFEERFEKIPEKFEIFNVAFRDIKEKFDSYLTSFELNILEYILDEIYTQYLKLSKKEKTEIKDYKEFNIDFKSYFKNKKIKTEDFDKILKNIIYFTRVPIFYDNNKTFVNLGIISEFFTEILVDEDNKTNKYNIELPISKKFLDYLDYLEYDNEITYFLYLCSLNNRNFVIKDNEKVKEIKKMMLIDSKHYMELEKKEKEISDYILEKLIKSPYINFSVDITKILSKNKIFPFEFNTKEENKEYLINLMRNLTEIKFRGTTLSGYSSFSLINGVFFDEEAKKIKLFIIPSTELIKYFKKMENSKEIISLMEYEVQSFCEKEKIDFDIITKKYFIIFSDDIENYKYLSEKQKEIFKNIIKEIIKIKKEKITFKLDNKNVKDFFKGKYMVLEVFREKLVETNKILTSFNFDKKTNTFELNVNKDFLEYLDVEECFIKKISFKEFLSLKK